MAYNKRGPRHQGRKGEGIKKMEFQQLFRRGFTRHQVDAAHPFAQLRKVEHEPFGLLRREREIKSRRALAQQRLRIHSGVG